GALRREFCATVTPDNARQTSTHPCPQRRHPTDHRSSSHRPPRILSRSAAMVIRRELEQIAGELLDRPRPCFLERSFAQTVRWFSEGENGRPVYEKGKSDIVKRKLGESDFGFMLDALPPGVDAELSALGGAVGRVALDRTAFPHRAGSSLVIQWGISW